MKKFRFHSLNKKPKPYHGKLCIVREIRETATAPDDREYLVTVEFEDGKQLDVFESELTHAPEAT